MKILFLNPHVDAGHQTVTTLQSAGVGVLLPTDAQEAWQMLQLHGTSIDLAIVHRELKSGQGEAGLQFTQKAKADPQQSDLPIILTSEKWSDAECATHQNSPGGVNAYCRWPASAEQITHLVEAVTGTKLSSKAAAAAKPAPAKAAPKAPTQEEASGFVLEDASGLFKAYEASDTSIKLEAPARESHEETPSLAVPAPSEVELAASPSASVALSASPVPEQSKSSIPTAEVSIPTGGSADLALAAVAPDEIPTASVPGTAALTMLGLGTGTLPTVEMTGMEAHDQGAYEQAGPDVEAAEQMPYIFGGSQGASNPGVRSAALAFAQPVGDAVVPGGAAHAPDMETLKKYLLLREQDVAALSAQLKSAREQVTALEDALRQERARNVETTHTIEEQRRKIENFDREKEAALEAVQTELNEARFQLKARTDKARLLENQVRDANEEIERIKERVRGDIRKIRVREKELENRLEIIKKDSEALIAARDGKIIELKRKLDLLEFNMDLLQDQYGREKETTEHLRERLAKVSQIVRVAGGLLDAKGNLTDPSEEDPDERKAS